MKTNSTRPPLHYFLYELRILYEIPSYFLTKLKSYKKGDGHPIIVFPGFTGTDLSTKPLRSFLKKINYKPHTWNLGVNLGVNKDIEEQLCELLHGVYFFHKRKVSLIGWSLGGVIAREIAKLHPDMVRCVITMGSPFNDIANCTNIKWLYDIIGTQKVCDMSKDTLQNFCYPPSVPTTSIYSRTDAIVYEDGSRNQICNDNTENIHVNSSHLGFGFNYLVYNIIANRLSQKEDNWKPYSKI